MLPSRLARFASPAMLAVRPYRVALLLLVFLAALCPAAAPPQVLAAGTTITVTTTADEMNDNDTCSLREAVDAAGSNQAVGACPAGGSGVDLIILPAGTYTLSLAGAHEDYNLTGDLDVVASMRIEGAGAAQTIIDGGGIDRIFDITFGDAHWPTPDVTISGVTLRHGANPVPTWSWDILTNAAWPSRYSGGAIRNAGRLVIEHSVISGNQAQINGGAILSVTALTLTDTQVTGNVVRLDVTDSVLIATIDLVAALRGGAIVAQDQVTISQSAIDDNLGGGIFNVVGSLAISNSSVSRNQASSGDGAGIYNLGGTLTLSGSQIAANTSAGGGAGVVGVSTSGSDYTYSSAITIADSSITGNQAGGSGGGILLLEGANPGAKATNALTITNSLIVENQAALDGGGIAVSPAAASLLLQTSVVSANVALAGGSGFGYGGIANNGRATIRDSTIRANSATTSRGHGGGIGNNGQLTIVGGAVQDNRATYAGGIYNTPSGTVTASGVTIADNTGTFTGGGVRNDGTFTLSGGTLSGNRATGSQSGTDDDMARGGGIFNLGTLTVRDGAQISGNSAYLGGGLANTTCKIVDATLGTLSLPGQATLRDATLSGNLATLWGGAITNEGALTISGATLSGNQTFSDHALSGVDSNGQTITIPASEAGLGGAIVNGIEQRFFGRGMPQWCVATTPAPTVRATITSSTISQNLAGQAVGGVANYTTMTISDTALLRNSAGNFAGGVHNAGTMTITASRIAENTAQVGFAGGVHNAATLTISASTVISNTAATDGGGIANGDTGTDLPEYLRLPVTTSPAQLQLTTTAIQSNQAGSSGGGIFSIQAGSSVMVSASTLTANTAGLNGGGIDTNATLSLANVTLSGNRALSQGGGLNVRSSGIVSADFATITANQLTSATGQGAELASRGQIRLRGSVVFHAGAAACSGTISSLGGNLLPVACVASASTSDLIGNDPLLASLAINGGPTLTHALLRGSPAIDAADSGSCPVTDQRGIARPIDGDNNGTSSCDSGAYEASLPAYIPPTSVYIPLIAR